MTTGLYADAQSLCQVWMAEYFTIPEVRRYRSYEEPDETPNRGARFGSWLPHVM